MEKFLTPKQVAERLAVSPKTVHRWVKDGKFKTVLFLPHGTVRFEATEIDKWINARKVAL